MRLLLALLFALAPLFSRAGRGVLAHLRAGSAAVVHGRSNSPPPSPPAKFDRGPRATSTHAVVRAREAELTTTPIKHVLIGPRLLDKSRTALGRVLNVRDGVFA